MTYIPPVPDFDFITDRLAVGARVGPQGLPVLREAGITHMVAVDTHPPLDLAAQFDITIFPHPFPDDLLVKPPTLLLPIAHNALRTLQTPAASLLVTCGAGMYRAPMVALLILRLLGHGLEEAQGLISTRRWGVGFPRAYVESVEATVLAWHQASEGAAAG
ncbi:MAG: hypothetical protein HYY02_06775 [Chloroflexi bacterium]|nr:hypothetical protein [Chloroflexota bacterium]